MTPRLFVLVERHVDVASMPARHGRGEERESSPYGLGALAELGWQVQWSSSTPSISFPARVARRVLGLDVPHAWRQRHAVAHADALYAHEDHDSLALCLAAVLARNTKALCPNVIWVATRWPRWGRLRRILVRRLLGVAPRLVVNSTCNVPALAALRMPPATYVRFGVARVAPLQTLRTPAPDLLVVGNDLYRDWDLLARLTERFADLSMLLVTGRAPQFSPGPNCEVRTVRDPRELAWLYGHSGVSLIPLVDNVHASGVTVLLEALQAGGRVVATDTGGLRDYASAEQVSFVPAGDQGRFEAAVRTLLVEPRVPRAVAVDTDLTRAAFLGRLSDVLHDVADGSRP